MDIMDTDGDLLSKVTRRKAFFESILEDDFDDWKLARDYGEFLVRIDPDRQLMGHFILARSYRHLGEDQRAVEELQRCRDQVAERALEPWESEMFPPLLDEERRRWS